MNTIPGNSAKPVTTDTTNHNSVRPTLAALAELASSSSGSSYLGLVSTQAQASLERRPTQLKRVSLTLAVIALLSGLYTLYSAFTDRALTSYIFTATSFAGAVGFVSCYFAAGGSIVSSRPTAVSSSFVSPSIGSSSSISNNISSDGLTTRAVTSSTNTLLPTTITSRRMNWVAVFLSLLALSEIMVDQLLDDSLDSYFLLNFFMVVPVLAGVLGLPSLAIRAITLSSVLGMVIGFLVKFNLYHTPGIGYGTLGNLLLSFVAVLFLTLSFLRQLSRAVQLSQAQSQELTKLVSTLNATNEVGVSLSHELSSVTSELNQVSQEQASSTQEQVAAVTEVTASLEELGETANQIAASARGASGSAQNTLEVALVVKQGREEALSVAAEGEGAVAQALMSVGQVRTRIELMGQRLLNLTEQTRRVGSIIDLIDEIADETHLLALNASIEAAGSIFGGSENGSSAAGQSSNRGERFGVIAQEIKNLAERSRESTEEVRQAITEMQGAVAAAVLVAEEGKKATVDAVLRSQIAGAVITKLNDIIEGGANRFDEIVYASEEVKARCDEISIATSQQRSANQQIVVTMRTVGEVARENVGLVSELSNKAFKVNKQVAQLNLILSFVTA